jgi:hypothetical protein
LELKVEDNNTTLSIVGNIKTVSDAINISNKIKDMIGKMGESRFLTLRIVDSMSLPSYTIGTLTKIIKVDGVELYTLVGNESLFVTLRNLNLLSVFNVRLEKFE